MHVKTMGLKNIVIYGASGTLGSILIEEAILRGHKVTGVSRKPSKLNIASRNFTSIQGDVTDIDSVRDTVTDADVVIVSVMGPPNVSNNEVTKEDKYTPKPEDSVQHLAALNMIKVSRELGEKAPRIIQLNGGSTLYYNGKQLFHYFPPGLQPAKDTGGYSIMWGHHVVLETYMATSDVNWTIATLAPGVEYGVRGERTNRPFKVSEGTFEVDPKLLEVKKDTPFVGFRKLLGDISAVDFGTAVFNEIENPQFIRRRFTAYYGDS
jgi:putative NADH-flavin reductase